jgi:hypothetical protein
MCRASNTQTLYAESVTSADNGFDGLAHKEIKIAKFLGIHINSY